MGYECEQTLGDSRRQRSLACCTPQGPKELDPEQLNNNIKICFIKKSSKIHHAMLLCRKRLGIKLETNLPFIFPGNQELWLKMSLFSSPWQAVWDYVWQEGGGNAEALCHCALCAGWLDGKLGGEFIVNQYSNPLQYSCLENPRDRGAWWAAIYGVAQSRTQLK